MLTYLVCFSFPWKISMNVIMWGPGIGKNCPTLKGTKIIMSFIQHHEFLTLHLTVYQSIKLQYNINFMFDKACLVFQPLSYFHPHTSCDFIQTSHIQSSLFYIFPLSYNSTTSHCCCSALCFLTHVLCHITFMNPIKEIVHHPLYSTTSFI